MAHKLSLLAVIFVICELFNSVSGHGMMVNPIHRGSRWRCDSSAIPNYDDNQLFCGGQSVQWEVHGGKCGVCGDNYGDKMPREHEIGGVYGKGVIVKQYVKGSVVDVEILITANHMGYFTFDLCNLDGSETDACFEKNKLLTVDGDLKWKVPTKENKLYTVRLNLPQNLVCTHCVLRWTYVAGNSWGECEDGSGGMGCGPQEHFRSCSDIAITTAVNYAPDWNDICSRQHNFIENILLEFNGQVL